MPRMPTACLVALCLVAVVLAARAAEPAPALVPGAGERVDRFVGQYVGTFTPAAGQAVPATGYVVARKDGYRVVLATAPLRPKSLVPNPDGLFVELSGPAAAAGPLVFAVPASPTPGLAAWSGTCDGQALTAKADGPAGGVVTLAYTVPRSPTFDQPPPAGATVLLGRDTAAADLAANWTNPAWTVLPDGSLQVTKGNNVTRQPIGDMQLHLEFVTPFEPAVDGQNRGNSGIYIQDRYEMQILDSFGNRPDAGDCASVYRVKAPDVNACFAPGVWQTYDITFRAARFDAAGTCTAVPEITLVHNGVTVQDKVKIQEPTGAGKARHKDKLHTAADPLQLQEHGHTVRFRNLWYTRPETANP